MHGLSEGKLSFGLDSRAEVFLGGQTHFFSETVASWTHAASPIRKIHPETLVLIVLGLAGANDDCGGCNFDESTKLAEMASDSVKFGNEGSLWKKKNRVELKFYE